MKKLLACILPSSFLRGPRRVRSLLAILTCFLLLSKSSAWSGEENELKRARGLLATGECGAAWDIAWPLAKDGNQEARYFLYQSINGRMLPPGVTRERDSYYRHVLALAAYAASAPLEKAPAGAVSNRHFARIDIPASISGLKLGPDGERVAQCYRTAPSFKACLDLGVSLGVIPTFANYAAETESRSKETGVGARCLPPN